jgi:hypothetical protein
MLYEGYKVVGTSHGEPFLGSRAQESKRITYDLLVKKSHLGRRPPAPIPNTYPNSKPPMGGPPLRIIFLCSFGKKKIYM